MMERMGDFYQKLGFVPQTKYDDLQKENASLKAENQMLRDTIRELQQKYIAENGAKAQKAWQDIVDKQLDMRTPARARARRKADVRAWAAGLLLAVFPWGAIAQAGSGGPRRPRPDQARPARKLRRNRQKKPANRAAAKSGKAAKLYLACEQACS